MQSRSAAVVTAVRFLCLCLIAAVLLLCAQQQPNPASRAWQVTEIDGKIAALQKQLDRLEEQKRRLLDMPEVPPPSEKHITETHIHTGPRNGKYHYTASGRKVYDRARQGQQK